MKQIYCEIRKRKVSATPEEKVRQMLVSHMLTTLRFPSHMLVVEQALDQMAHLKFKLSEKLPDRRADLICFGSKIHPIHPLYPLLLVECKAVKLTTKTLSQISGYNYHLGAYFIAIANAEEIKTGWYNPKINDYSYVNFLPTYEELLSKVKLQGPLLPSMNQIPDPCNSCDNTPN